MLKSFFPFIVLLFFSAPAASFFPEFEHHTREDQNEINSPRLFDGEYLSDKITFEMPLQWMVPWLESDKVFQYSAGSLGPTRFLTRGRMKLTQSLGHGLEFRLSYLDHGDYEAHKKALVVEFAWEAFDFLKLSLYGEPQTLKKDDNVGFSATLFPAENHSVRIYRTLVHFSHNKRSEGVDTYSKKPGSNGFVWRWVNPETHESSELYYRQDQDTQLNDLTSNQTYTYGWHKAGWFGRFSMTDENLDFFQARLESEKGYEGDTVNTDNGIPRWETERHSAWLQHQAIGGFIDLYGLRYSYQEWNSVQGRVIHSDWIPHLWVPIYEGFTGATGHSLHGGYEFTWHRGQGDPVLRSQLDTNNKLEHRGNLRYQLRFKETTSMNFLLTLDLDKFATGETWEGGSIQFTTVF